MKPPRSHPIRWIENPVRLPLTGAIGLCIAFTAWPSLVQAEAVDSELVLLVDIVQPELSNTNFNRLVDVRPAGENTQGALQVIHANACPTSNRTQHIRVHRFEFFSVIPHIR